MKEEKKKRKKSSAAVPHQLYLIPSYFSSLSLSPLFFPYFSEYSSKRVLGLRQPSFRPSLNKSFHKLGHLSTKKRTSYRCYFWHWWCEACFAEWIDPLGLANPERWCYISSGRQAGSLRARLLGLCMHNSYHGLTKYSLCLVYILFPFTFYLRFRFFRSITWRFQIQ